MLSFLWSKSNIQIFIKAKTIIIHWMYFNIEHLSLESRKYRLTIEHPLNLGPIFSETWPNNRLGSAASVERNLIWIRTILCLLCCVIAIILLGTDTRIFLVFNYYHSARRGAIHTGPSIKALTTMTSPKSGTLTPSRYSGTPIGASLVSYCPSNTPWDTCQYLMPRTWRLTTPFCKMETETLSEQTLVQ